MHYSDTSAIDYGTEFEIHSRLLSSLGMYLSCFPEMLKDGPPDDVKHPSYHQYADAKTIGNIARSPHPFRTRRGHAALPARTLPRAALRAIHKEAVSRLCSSSSASVKGEAATILSPEQSETL